MPKWFLTGLLLSIGLLYLTQSADGCMCAPTHTQSMYCSAEYVIIARVLRKRHVGRNNVYKIEIKETYKSSPNSNIFLKEGRISTADSDSMCGITLHPGKLYMIAANGPRIGICNYVKEYSRMTIVEKRGFAGGYKKGCACDIHTVWGPAHKSIGACNWKPTSKCESDYGACVPSRGKLTAEGKPVKCHWRQSQAYNTCVKS